jgi:putative membrane protein
MISLSPLVLFMSSLVVCYPVMKNANKKTIIWCSVAYVLTFCAEVVGVKSGLIFGDYHYGTVLGFKLLEVPLIIGINWMLIMLGSIALAKSCTKNIYSIALLAGLFSVLFDVILEPVAITLGYWQWSTVSPPLSNYYSWFIIVFLLTIPYCKLKVEVDASLPRFYLFVQTVFFLSLNVVL